MNAHIILPECSDDPISDWMRGLTKAIANTGNGGAAFGLGGEHGYGENFENDVFSMNKYCWCDNDDCALCNGTKPNFLHKKSGASIKWYKYIGRGMEVDEANWPDIFTECFQSLIHPINN